jgi:hypothetical protein
LITADSTGTVEAGQLPIETPFKRYNGTTDVTTSAAWSRALVSGNATTTIGAATGILELTGPTNLTDSVVRVTSVHNAVTLTSDFAINKSTAAPSSGGSGGGSSASDTSFSSINSAVHAAISDELTVLAGAGGNVDLTAALVVRTGRSNPVGAFPVFAIFKWWDGAAWADVGTEVESDPDATVTAGVDLNTLDEGLISISTQKTGLVAASSHKFRLYARSSSGTRVMTFTGSCGASGS